MSAGIYCIRHLASGRGYVGSAVNLARRRGAHLRALAAGRHANARLQAAWAKHGADAFSFEVLEQVADVAHLIEREQAWIDRLQSVANGYNLRLVASSNLGLRMSSDARSRMSKSRTGLKRPAHAIEATRQANTGRMMSEATKAKIAAAKRGKARQPEHVAALAAKNRGKTRSAETRLKISMAGRGRPKSAEAVAKLRVALTGRTRNPASVAASAAGHRGATRSPEARERMRQAQLRRYERERAAVGVAGDGG